MPHNFSKDRSLIEDKPVEKKIGLLEEFEEWLKEEIKFNQYDDLGIAFNTAKNKLESLKEKYHIPK
jgi:hypothetical protein